MNVRAAIAGAAAAAVSAAFEPLARRTFDTEFSDVRLVSFPVHLANGAVFGIVFDRARRRVQVGATTAALVEHVALWPLLALIDKRAARDPRAFASSGFTHLVFGIALGALSPDARRV